MSSKVNNPNSKENYDATASAAAKASPDPLLGAAPFPEDAAIMASVQGKKSTVASDDKDQADADLKAAKHPAAHVSHAKHVAKKH